MSITDEGHYGPKQLNLLKTVWGEGFLSPGGTDEIDEILKGIMYQTNLFLISDVDAEELLYILLKVTVQNQCWELILNH